MGFPLSDAEHAAIKARIDSQPELIVAAAIRVEPDLFVVTQRPGRHGVCISFLHWLAPGIDYHDQGFMTNRGRFVDRVEAAAIVAAAGQGSKREDITGLFSEDMWNDWDERPQTPIRPEDIFGSMTPQNLEREGGSISRRAATNSPTITFPPGGKP
jgi:hypothetical protein